MADASPEELERSMNTKSKLDFVAKCDPSDGIRLLESVDGIREYTVEETDGGSLFTLDCDDGNDLREAIFFAFADARRPILSMSSRRLTLEDIFLKLTTPQVDEDEADFEDEEETEASTESDITKEQEDGQE